MKINDQDVSVSYDVSSLFTNVPVDETTIESNANRAFENDWFNIEHILNITKSDLIELLRIATKNQQFFSLKETSTNRWTVLLWVLH